MLIGLSGRAGSGKDTIADFLVNEFNFTKLSFGKILKDIVSVIFSWDRKLLEGDTIESREFREKEDIWWSNNLQMKITPRIALQKIGTEVFRDNFHPDIWLLALKKEISKYSKVVITDIRFINEYNMIKQMNGKIWKIHRDNISRYNHSSENMLDDFDYDRIITNNDTLVSLYEKIKLLPNLISFKSIPQEYLTS